MIRRLTFFKHFVSHDHGTVDLDLFSKERRNG